MVAAEGVIILAVGVIVQVIAGKILREGPTSFCQLENAPADMFGFSQGLLKGIAFCWLALLLQMGFPLMLDIPVQGNGVVGAHIALGALLIARMFLVKQRIPCFAQLGLLLFIQFGVAVVGVIAEGIHLQIFKAQQGFFRRTQQMHRAHSVVRIVSDRGFSALQTVVGIFLCAGKTGGALQLNAVFHQLGDGVIPDNDADLGAAPGEEAAQIKLAHFQGGLVIAVIFAQAYINGMENRRRSRQRSRR